MSAYEVMKLSSKEHVDDVTERIIKLNKYFSTGENHFDSEEISKLKETFGSQFLTEDYYLNIEGI